MYGRIVATTFRLLIGWLSTLSFGTTQRLGKIVGSAFYLLPTELRRITRRNLSVSFPSLDAAALARLTRQSLKQTGCYAAEAGLSWSVRDQRWNDLIIGVDGSDAIDAARRSGHGVLVLIPHFGNWEILNLFLGARYGFTVLYEPLRVASLDSIVRAGRTRTGSAVVPTSVAGIRALRVAMKAGGVVGVLPDQVPSRASGEYVAFFGRPALTMTLVHRLSQNVSTVLLGYARRLPDGAGFRIGFEAIPNIEHCTDASQWLTSMNAAIERLVRSDPAQYQWEYRRFRKPPPGDTSIY